MRPPYVTLKPIKCLALTNHDICLSNFSLGIWKLVSIGREINGLCNLGIKFSPLEYACASQLRNNFVLKFSYGRYISRILILSLFLFEVSGTSSKYYLHISVVGTERNNYCNSLIIRRTTQKTFTSRWEITIEARRVYCFARKVKSCTFYLAANWPPKIIFLGLKGGPQTLVCKFQLTLRVIVLSCKECFFNRRVKSRLVQQQDCGWYKLQPTKDCILRRLVLTFYGHVQFLTL